MSRVAEKQATYADYLQTPEGAAYQLIGGQLVMTPAPNPRHQIVALRVATSFHHFVAVHDLGQVVAAPVDVFFSETETFQPDIIYIPKTELWRIGERRVEGPPALVGEVLSPTSGYYDLTHKKDVYESSGVREYWIVDPNEATVEVMHNLSQGFVRTSRAKRTGVVASCLLEGFTISLEEIFV